MLSHRWCQLYFLNCFWARKSVKPWLPNIESSVKIIDFATAYFICFKICNLFHNQKNYRYWKLFLKLIPISNCTYYICNGRRRTNFRRYSSIWLLYGIYSLCHIQCRSVTLFFVVTVVQHKYVNTAHLYWCGYVADTTLQNTDETWVFSSSSSTVWAEFSA